MDKKQADAIAESLLLEGRAEQSIAARKKQEAARRTQMQRRIGAWGLIGLGAGMVVGQIAFGSTFPAGMLGLGIGMGVGRLTSRQNHE